MVSECRFKNKYRFKNTFWSDGGVFLNRSSTVQHTLLFTLGLVDISQVKIAAKYYFFFLFLGVLLNCVVSSREPRYVEACLCCLRTLFSHPDAPVEVLYSDPAIIPHLLALMPLSTSNQISVASILMNR